MTIRTSPTLPVGDYATRKTAASVASNVRSGKYSGYRSRRYEARPLTNADGIHQVWGRYIGEVTR